MSESIEKIENNLINISLKIGSVAEKNSQFTHGLALRLSKLGSPIDQLTVGVLMEQTDQYVKGFNSIFGDEQ